METFWWILGSGIAMSLIALSGSITLVLPEATLQRIIMPLVSLAAGTLIGGAFFHMVPAGLGHFDNIDLFFFWVLAGFSCFFAIEQLLHWHHCQRAQADCRQPLTYLILIGDGLHNLIGGLSIGAVFVADVRLGLLAWLAAAAHEVPQELGDFGVLIHGGWKRKQALLFNFLSGLTFLAGSLLAYGISFSYDIAFLIPFAAGNFLYIGASDLIPEVRLHQDSRLNLLNFTWFLTGAGLMLAIKFVFPEG